MTTSQCPRGIAREPSVGLQVYSSALHRPLAIYHYLASTFLRCLTFLAILVMTYKVRLHRQPQYLRELINDHLPARFLRSSNNAILIVPSTKTATATRAFRVAAARIWNYLPITIRNETSLH